MKKKEPRWALIGVATGFLILLTLWGLTSWQYHYVSGLTKESKSIDPSFGISGDFFGFPNAVFSALAFAMIIVTLVMQRYELKQQRIELKITRRVFRQQKKEMNEQNESLRRQTFENTFFSMLRMHREILADILGPDNKKTGRTAFRDFRQSLKDEFRKGGTQTPDPLTPQYKIECYNEWYTRYENDLGHYFRVLYNIITYVDETKLSNQAETERELKKHYAQLVRAQLSANELHLLIYNGLGEHGRKKFKPLIEKYSLLKHLRDTDTDDLRPLYHPSAFGEDEDPQ